MDKVLKKKIQITTAILLYIIMMGLNIWYVRAAYPDFLNVYGDKSFSKGVFGVVFFSWPNILTIAVATIFLGYIIKKINRNAREQ